MIERLVWRGGNWELAYSYGIESKDEHGWWRPGSLRFDTEDEALAYIIALQLEGK